MAPPAKRQKRLLVMSSGDEEPDTNSIHKPIPTRSRAKAKRSNTDRSTIAIQPASDNVPQDHATKPKSAGKAQTSRPISSFFSARTEAQQPNGQRPPEAVTPEVEDHEDLIVDDSPVENVNDFGGKTIRTALYRRQKHPVPSQDIAAATNKPSRQSGSQRFKIPGHASSMGVSPGISGEVKAKLRAIDLRPWAEKYGPNNLEELMVHKKKVLDVRNWLEIVLWGQDRKVRFSKTFCCCTIADCGQETFDSQRAFRCWEDRYNIYACQSHGRRRIRMEESRRLRALI